MRRPHLVLSTVICIAIGGIASAQPPRIDAEEQLAGGEKSGFQSATIRGRIDPIIVGNEESSESEHISIVMVGDTGFAPSGVSPKADGVSKHGTWLKWSQTTDRVKHLINGDINFANMESVVSSNGALRPRPKAFNFMTHPNGVKHLTDIGFNLFAMANNHTFDYGAQGVVDSLEHMNALRKEGHLHHAGAGLNRNQAAAVVPFTVKDTRFLFGSIGIGASRGGARASDKRPGQLSIYDRNDRDLLANNFAESAGDYRILSVHRGIERQVKVSRDEIRQARNYLTGDANVDLIAGHHAHVARGVELNKGRVIFYGLGNFLHQGTANMAKSGGCRDYSLLARAHLVKISGKKPKLAAIEVVPLTATHLRPEPLSPRKAAKRIAVLNGLATQFDQPSQGAEGIRFDIQEDGTGLFCTSVAQENPKTASLCKSYRKYDQRDARTYRAAVSSCGSSFGTAVLATGTVPPRKPVVKKRVKTAAPKRLTRKKVRVSSVKATALSTARFTKLSNKQLARLSSKDQTRNWTRYWYFKKGKSIPKHLR